MTARPPMVLLDDARTEGAADALLYERPDRVFVARSPDEVGKILEQADQARIESGQSLAGYIAYEAGLALEPRLAPRAAARNGSAGPLVWLGLFDQPRRIPAGDVGAFLADRADRNTQAGRAGIGPLDPQISPGAYARAFAQLQDTIRAGDIYQANLTFPLAGAFTGDPLALYAALRPAAQAGYGGLVFDGAPWLLSLSPELFVALKDRAARTKPMKGTRPRGNDADSDAALRDELAGSEKDRAENLMIVDLLRNDLARVAEPGSVAVDTAFAVETYPTVHQMVSTVHARLAPERGAMDLVRALFPCGSITGAPKIRAMELIDTVERDARGPYCGAIGRIDGDGGAAFNVAIRTLRLTEIENGRGKAVLGVGGAIVADSDPQVEWREAVLKGGFARASSPDLTAPNFDLVETMLFAPDEGVALLELHLERAKESARALSFAFDRHEARNQIQALTFDLDRPHKVRLRIARGGAIALEAGPVPAAPQGAARCIVLPLPVNSGDWRLRHKVSDRGFYEEARAVAEAEGVDEALFMRDDGLVTEGSIATLFVERDGVLLTPPLALGLLPGVLRRSLIDRGRAKEADLTMADLADGFWLGNAVRGLWRARLAD